MSACEWWLYIVTRAATFFLLMAMTAFTSRAGLLASVGILGRNVAETPGRKRLLPLPRRAHHEGRSPLGFIDYPQAALGTEDTNDLGHAVGCDASPGHNGDA